MVGWHHRAQLAAGQLDDLAGVGGLEHGAVQGGLGWPERDLAAVEAQHAVPPARLVDVVGGDHHAAPLGSELGEQRLQAIRARRVEPRERLVEEDHPRVLHQRTRDQYALALAAREVAEGRVGLLGQPHGRQRRPRRAALRASGAPPPGQRRDRSHECDVERADGEVQPRALGLRDDGEARGCPQRSGHGPELAEEHAEECRLAATVGAQDGHPLAGVQREGHVGEHGRRAVAGGEALRLHQGQIPAIGHPRAPAVKPRTIASALARSMVR